MRRLFAAGFLSASLFASAASAQVVDISTIKCKEFVDSDKERISYIMMWLAGYYMDEDDPAVIDFDRMKRQTEKLVTYCTQNPTLGVITAAERVMKE
jgi:acid stress chaperone HdeB